jgi:hypothetical protein
MQIKKNLKQALPHLIAVLLFTIVSFVYFYPVLEGKILRANDSMVARFSSKEIADFREKTGDEPLWTNAVFGGMPTYLISVKHPGNLLKKLDLALRVFKMPVSVMFLSLAGFYLVLLMFGVNPWLAMAGSFAYGLSSFFFLILAAGHNTQAIALAYMAPMIGGIWYAYRKDAIMGALFTGFILSLELLANHPQITYYALICLLVFGITEMVWSIREKALVKFLKTSAILIIPFVLAIGVNFANLYTINEYGKYSIRGKSELVTGDTNKSAGLDRNYITNWSYGIGETMNLLIPNFKGGSSKPFDRNSETVRALRQNDMSNYATQFSKYWGTQPGTEGPHYLGAVVVFLFILGLILIKSREKWWLLIATLLSIVLAWGSNFMPLTNFFIDYFPGYNKFRAVTMTLVIAQFCVPLLGLLALRDIFSGALTKKEIIRGLKIATGVTGGVTLLYILIPGLAGSFLNDYESSFQPWLKTVLISDRKDLLRTDSFRSLVFILLSSGVILGFLMEKLRMQLAIMIIGALIFFDLWTVDKRYLNADRFERQKSISPSSADIAILNDPAHKRVLNIAVSVFNDNSPTSYFHRSVGGYHGAKMKRYQELIDSSLTMNIGMIYDAFNNSQSLEEIQRAFAGTGALNMLNTKYLIYDPASPPIMNPNALGNAWFIETPILVANANEEISAVNKLDPVKEAVIDRIFEKQLTQAKYEITDGDKIELTSYQPNELKYKYSASSEKLVIFSEIYYPKGWKAFIDDNEVDYFRANYVLRAMIVPAGDHEIRFAFMPASYYTGNKVSLASSVLLILILAGYIAIRVYPRFKKQ